MFDGICYAPATEMENARKELACLDNQLVKARQIWQEDKKEMDKRWTTSIERYDDIYESLPKFNGYYKAIDYKLFRIIIAISFGFFLKSGLIQQTGKGSLY